MRIKNIGVGVFAALAGAALVAGPAAAAPVSTSSLPGAITDASNGAAGSGAIGHLRVPKVPNATTTAPPAAYPVNGIDVSSHDHNGGATINWVAQKAGGDDFAYMKATEGTSYTNSYFSSDYSAAKSAGLYAGAYAYGRPDLGDPVGQANYFIDHAQFSNDGKTLPPFLDMEWPYSTLGLPTCFGLSTTAMTSWIGSFMNTVQARTGTTPMIYTNVNWWNPCTGSSGAFSGYLLDVSSCDASPPSAPGWGTHWTLWQYDIDACGRGAAHDSDVFNGTTAQLAQLAGASSTAIVGGEASDFTGDGKPDIIARTADGTLLLYPGTGTNVQDALLSAPVRIGVGWGPMTALFTGDFNHDSKGDIVARTPDGTLLLYPGTGHGTQDAVVGSPVQIGVGWGPMTALLAGDFNHDGNSDIIGRLPDGSMTLYPGTGNAVTNAVVGTPLRVGVGWDAMTALTTGDFNHDTKTDIVARAADGTLTLYPGTGTAVQDAVVTSPVRIGIGWQSMTALVGGDFTNDGKADLMARTPDGTLSLYPGTGNATQDAVVGAPTRAGVGWQAMTALS